VYIDGSDRCLHLVEACPLVDRTVDCLHSYMIKNFVPPSELVGSTEVIIQMPALGACWVECLSLVGGFGSRGVCICKSPSPGADSRLWFFSIKR